MTKLVNNFLPGCTLKRLFKPPHFIKHLSTLFENKKIYLLLATLVVFQILSVYLSVKLFIYSIIQSFITLKSNYFWNLQLKITMNTSFFGWLSSNIADLKFPKEVFNVSFSEMIFSNGYQSLFCSLPGNIVFHRIII